MAVISWAIVLDSVLQARVQVGVDVLRGEICFFHAFEERNIRKCTPAELALYHVSLQIVMF